jgi:hypothetical protein
MKVRKSDFVKSGSVNDLNDMNGSRIPQWMYREDYCLEGQSSVLLRDNRIFSITLGQALGKTQPPIILGVFNRGQCNRDMNVTTRLYLLPKVLSMGTTTIKVPHKVPYDLA